MLILIPFVVIVLIIFAVDLIYFDDVKPKNSENQQKIEKSDNRKNYINKYLKK